MSTGTEVATLAQKKTQIENALVERTAVLKELLPADAVEQAPRLIRLAMLYFTRNPQLQEATPISFIQCAFDSVAAGIPLDGKLGHSVVYNVKMKRKDDAGRVEEWWEKHVKFMPDFKGIVVVARRTEQIRDAQSGVVYEKDYFVHGRQGPNVQCDHTPFDGDRGAMKGVYCILTFDDGNWTYEYMAKSEVDKVRASSKAANDGPWVNWYDQMARKTVLKRALKTYCDDPQLLAALKADDDWHEHAAPRESRVQQSSISVARPDSTSAIASAVAEQNTFRSQPQQETSAPSTPRSQRKEQEQQREELHEETAEVSETQQQQQTETAGSSTPGDDPLLPWQAMIDEAGNDADLAAVDEMLTKSTAINSNQKATVLGWIAERRKKVGTPKKGKKGTDGELFPTNPNTGS